MTAKLTCIYAGYCVKEFEVGVNCESIKYVNEEDGFYFIRHDDKRTTIIRADNYIFEEEQ